MAGMDVATLQKWEILSQLSTECLSKLWSAHIFKVGGGLGALLLTTDDEVHYVGDGHHSLFRRDGDHGKGGAMKSRVNELSGVGVKKLGVGDNFCVALTEERGLQFWSSAVNKTPEMAFESFRVHSELPEEKPVACPDCDEYLVVQDAPGLSMKFTYCPNCEDINKDDPNNDPKKNQIVAKLTVMPPRQAPKSKQTNKTSSSKVKRVRFDENGIKCPECNSELCTSLEIGDRQVNHCKSCNYLPREADFVNPPKSKKGGPQLINLSDSVDMIDLACGKDFFVLLTSQNDLILWGKIGDLEYEGILYKADDVVAKAVSCGSNHVAVLTVQGELYTCGRGNLGQLGYEWTLDMGYDTLRKVPLDGKVAKVYCGYTSTVCLMTDGSLMCFGSHMKVLPSGVLALNQPKTDYISGPVKIDGMKRVTNVVNCPGTDIFFAKTENFVFTWGRQNIKSARLQLVPCGGNLMAALADLPASFTFKIRKSTSALHNYQDSDFYGQHLLSDLTLKLSDGDFPVHRLVLIANSVYFQDTFRKTLAGACKTELDMTNYNPEAYRCLLKYFYQVPPTNLEASDLFDLYTLAASYKEVEIAQDVFDKLKAALNSLTVLSLLRKAKEVNCPEVLEECNAFISSPEFKHNLAEKVSQDPGKTMSLLEALEKN